MFEKRIILQEIGGKLYHNPLIIQIEQIQDQAYGLKLTLSVKFGHKC